MDVQKSEVTNKFKRAIFLKGTNSSGGSCSSDLKINIVTRNEVFKNKVSNYFRTYIRVPSSTYDCICSYNMVYDYIELNFSVAKAAFGTNVLMFCKNQIIGKPFNVAIDRNNQIECAYNNLFGYLGYFFKMVASFDDKELLEFFMKVSIKRFDLCVNQILENKTDAERLILCLQRTRRRKSRNVQKDRVYDGTGVYFASDNYTIKIYHKSQEYFKNDRVELMEKGIKQELIDEFQLLADRTIRYEMEFRNIYLSKIFINECFRRNDMDWKEIRWCYYIYSRKYYSMDYDGKIEYLKKRGTDFIQSNFKQPWTLKYKNVYSDILLGIKTKRSVIMKIKQIDKIVRDKAKIFESFLNKTYDFRFNVDKSSLEYVEFGSIKDKNERIYDFFFSGILFKKCFKKFWEFVDEYQIKESLITVKNSDTRDILKKKFDEVGFNGRVTSYIGIYNLLQTGKSWREISAQKIYPKSTLDKYKSVFKKINIDDKNVDIYHINKKEPLLSYFNLLYYKKSTIITSLIYKINFPFK
jgi:hypothetical protein